MQSREDEESLSQSFTYQEQVTGLLTLTVTCTYPRSAVSFIFLTPLGDTFASKELNPTSNVGNFYREKKIYPQTMRQESRYSFYKQSSQAQHIRTLRDSNLVSSLVTSTNLSEQKCSHFTDLYSRGVCSIFIFSGLQSI